MADLIARLRKPTWITIDGVDCLSSTAVDNMKEAAAEIERLRAALEQCAASYETPPTTVMGAAAHVAAEFRRRMDIAGNALAPDEQ